MLPSPSEGAPWSSLSRSPAFAPCGIPDELDCEDDAAGAADELVDDGELLPPPQPASASASTTSSPLKSCHLRFDLVVMCGSSGRYALLATTTRGV